MNKNSLPLSEKIAYGFGDFGFSMFWKLFSAYILFFYTDVFGITAAAAGTMFLVTRIWDTANDPIMGMIGDRTKSKWGKFRPYLLFGAVPFAIVGIITFSTPEVSESSKLIYAYITYTLMMMIYTICNVPYASLLGVMSSNSHERTSLATWRYIGGYLGGLLVTTTANYLFEYFSGNQISEIAVGGNPVITPAGFQYTIAVYAILTAIAILISFRGVKERVVDRKEKNNPVSADLSDLLKNGPWLLMFGVIVCVILGGTVKDGIILFYTKYYLGEQEIFFIGKVSQSGIASILLTIGMGFSLLGVILAIPVSDRLGKKNTFMLSTAVAVVFNTLFYFLKPDQVNLMIIYSIIMAVFGGMLAPITWSMYGDISDYSEWKNKRRATGLIFSSSSATNKLGWTLGSSITGWLLAYHGFEANVVQTQETIMGMKIMIGIIPATLSLAALVFIWFYPLTEKKMSSIKAELEAHLAAETAE